MLLGGGSSESLAVNVADSLAGLNCVRVSLAPTIFSLNDVWHLPVIQLVTSLTRRYP